MNSKSLLAWSPGSGKIPKVKPLVESLKLNDLGIAGDGLGEFHAFGSLIDFFGGTDEKLRTQFRQDFSKYLIDGTHPTRIHPAAIPVETSCVDFFSYRVPWEWAYDEFIDWYRRYRGRNDFIEAAGRKWNDYRGNLGCHLVDSVSFLSNIEILKKNNGSAGCFRDDIQFVCDNRYNPYRWVGPINEIQHHEQAALCCTIPSTLEARKYSEDIFSGNAKGRILLEYEIELEIEDLRPELGEQSIFDFYGIKELTEPLGVVSQTHWNAMLLTKDAEMRGQKFSYGQKRFVQQWLDKRYVNPNLQVSLMVNFRQRANRYRLAEFMLAEYNQSPIFFYDESVPSDIDSGRSFNPFRLDGNGIIPTSNDEMNTYVVDGGCSGNFAWTRTPIDVFKQVRFAPQSKIIEDGGDCWRWDGQGRQKRSLYGVIDISSFYRQSRMLGYFPGQRGYWGNCWVGFEGDVPEFQDPAEIHGIEWLGLIFENHGPFRIDMRATRLDLVLER